MRGSNEPTATSRSSIPELRKIVATPKTDSPTYQKNTESGKVERGVHQRVGLDILLASHVREVDGVVGVEQRTRQLVERLQVWLLDLPAAGQLLDDQLRIA